MAYATTSDLANYLGRALTTQESAMFTIYLGGVTNSINSYTSRQFEIASAGSKLYNGTGTKCLYVDDMTVITSINYVDVDTTTVLSTFASTDFLAYPLNTTPKQWIEVRGGWFERGEANIKIAGTFGYASAIPSAITMATVISIADYINNPEQLLSESIEGYSRTFGSGTTNTSVNNQDFLLSSKVLTLLDGYKRIVM